MGVYEPIKQHVEKRVPENRQFLAALSGGLGAGLAASIVRVPTEVVKQRMQNGEFPVQAWPGSPVSSCYDQTSGHQRSSTADVGFASHSMESGLIDNADHGRHLNYIQKNAKQHHVYVRWRRHAGEFGGAAIAVRNILKREGMKGLFAGYGSFLLRDLPFDAIEFVAYEQLKSMYKVRLAVCVLCWHIESVSTAPLHSNGFFPRLSRQALHGSLRSRTNILRRCEFESKPCYSTACWPNVLLAQYAVL